VLVCCLRVVGHLALARTFGGRSCSVGEVVVRRPSNTDEVGEPALGENDAEESTRTMSSRVIRDAQRRGLRFALFIKRTSRN
jgi:hypothetical protein